MKDRQSSFLLAFVIAACCWALPAPAQTAIYGEYGVAGPGLPNSGYIHGPAIGAYFDRGTFINYGVDFRGTFLSDGNNTQFDSGMAGLRVAVKPHLIPLNPYGELLGGIAHENSVVNSAKNTHTNLGYEVAVGLELTVLPHIDWRVVEYSYSAMETSPIRPKSLSMGLVFRIP